MTEKGLQYEYEYEYWNVPLQKPFGSVKNIRDNRNDRPYLVLIFYKDNYYFSDGFFVIFYYI